MPDPREVTGDPAIIVFTREPQTPEAQADTEREIAEVVANLEAAAAIDTTIDPFKNVCDLCGRVGVAWIYPCDSFILPQINYQSVADWATCDPCGELVEADDVPGILARRLANREPDVEEAIAAATPEMKERIERSRELFVRSMLEAFMAHRWGERRRYDPGEDREMPEAIRVLPRDERGLPIPFAQLRVDGRPDFRSLDQARVAQCVNDRLCDICGRALSYWIAFIGGPACERNRLFKDPAMHPECAVYAARTCPFIAGSHTKYSSRPLPEGPDLAVHVDRNMADHERRPVDMFIFTTRRYRVVEKHRETYIEASPWANVERIEPLR